MRLFEAIKALFHLRLPDDNVRSTVGLAAAFNLLGMPVELFIIRNLPQIPRWPLYVSMGFGATLLLVILFSPSSRGIQRLKPLFVINSSFVAFALMSVYANVGLNRDFVYFQASKLGMLVGPLLAPSYLTGLLGILVHAGSSIFLFYHLSPEVQQMLTPENPGALIGFAMGGFFILTQRFLGKKSQLEAMALQAEALSVRKLAESFLTLRDLMNTPLQSIELATALLEKGTAEKKQILTQLRDSCERLRQLNLLLKKYEKSNEWKESRGGLSSDPL